jgi:1-acyl-sn-glycerol-3-phosphate acyltransferase
VWKRLLYYILKNFFKILMFLLISCKVKGRENVPNRGSVLILANHLSIGDPVIIGVYLKRKINFMAKEELFRNKVLGHILKSIGTFPVYRGSSNRDALRQAEIILKGEHALGMFPEGTRSLQNELQVPLYGAALIACHNHVPMIPIGISGTEKIRGLSWIWHRPRVTLTIGPPFYLPEVRHRLTKEILEQNSNIIMGQIAELLPLSYQGKYAKREQDGNKN